MTILRFFLVLFLAVVLPLSSAIPAEDMPETAYDESEEIPYERTSFFSSEVLLEDVTALQSAPALCMPGASFSTQASERFAREVPHVRVAAVSPSLLDHALRC